MVLDKVELVLQHAWLHGSIGLKQAAEILGTSAGKAGYRLRSLAEYGILQRDEKCRQVTYTLPDEYVKFRSLLL
jgi:Fic family protein